MRLSVEAEYSVDFSRSNRKFCLSVMEVTVFHLVMLQKYMNTK